MARKRKTIQKNDPFLELFPNRSAQKDMIRCAEAQLREFSAKSSVESARWLADPKNDDYLARIFSNSSESSRDRIRIAEYHARRAELYGKVKTALAEPESKSMHITVNFSLPTTREGLPDTDAEFIDVTPMATVHHLPESST
jgi:hypothetical protein